MFLNKTVSSNNLCGKKIREFRKKTHISQREMAELLRENGLLIDKNAVQRIETGLRFVVDTEVGIIANTIGISVTELLDIQEL